MTRPRGSAARTAPGPSLLAWALGAACVVGTVAGSWISLTGAAPAPWKFLILPVVLSVPGTLIAAARPRALLGWLLLAVALCFAVSALAQVSVRSGVVDNTLLTAVAVWYVDRFSAVMMPIGILALLLLPDSRLPGPGWRGPVGAVVVAQLLMVVVWSFSDTPAAQPDGDWPAEVLALDNPVGVLPGAWVELVAGLGWLLPFPMLLAVVAMAVRVRRLRGEGRSRLMTLLLALAVLVGATLGGNALGDPASDVVELVASLFFALVLVSAVLRRHLEGVTVVVHHAFVYTVLGALVVTVYVLMVGAIAATGPQLSRFGAGVLAACAALAVHPLRSRLQAWVDRLMHGDRKDPYLAVTRLAERAHGVPSLEGVLQAVAAAVAASLRARLVVVEAFGLRVEHPARSLRIEVEAAATWHRAALLAGGRQIGSVQLALRPGRHLRADERRLLQELGRHAGIAVDAVQLAQQVAEHHRALVTAREEERRRVGRELHDGLGPTLAGLSMQLGALRPLVRSAPDAVVARLAELESAAGSALQDVRRVAHELRTPVLDQVGLEQALRDVAGSLGLSAVEVDGRTGDLPAAVETAAYRIACEALTNVSRHSHATTVQVRLATVDGVLLVRVEDDGRGVAVDREPTGLGMSTMRERAEELGGSLTVLPSSTGGTVVSALIPVEDRADHAFRRQPTP